MIKVITNKTYLNSLPRIDVACKGVRKNLIISSSYEYFDSIPYLGFDKKSFLVFNDSIVFVKFSFSGLTTDDKIAKAVFSTILLSNTCDLTLKLFYIPSLTSFPNNPEDLMSQLDTSDNYLIEQVAVANHGAYGNEIIQTPVSFDLTEIISSLNSTNPEFIVALVADNSSDNPFLIFDPEDLKDDIEEVQALTPDSRGINLLNRFDEISCSSMDNGYINIVSGEVTHLFNLFQTFGKKMPISLSLAHSFNRKTDGNLLPNKLKLNIEYSIYVENDIYIIEDYTGYRRAYKSLVNNSSDTDFESLGIRHTVSGASLYYCDEDCSYIFVQNGEGGSKFIELYDKNDNYMQFLRYGNNTQLKKIRNSLGDEINLTWSFILSTPNQILSISNTNDDSVTFSYNSSSPYYLNAINFVKEKRSFTLSYSSGVTYLSFNNTENNNTVLIKKLELSFDSGELTSIEEKNSSLNLMKKLTYSYSSNKVSNASLFDYNNNLIGYKNYSYHNLYTSVTDFENNVLYYYFDKYGRVRTILDNKGRTESFNYEEIKNGVVKGVTGKSKIQCNSKNYLENHSFEYLDNSGNLMSWTKTGNGSYELSYDGLYGGKCLHINTSSDITLSQSFPNVDAGSYRLKIKAKAVSLSSCIVRATFHYKKMEYVEVFNPHSPLPSYQYREIEHTENFDITNIAVSSDWEEYISNIIQIDMDMYSITIAIQIISTGTNDVYFDDFQFSNTDQITRYNLIENGYLEKITNHLPTGWDTFNLTENDKMKSISSSDEHFSIIGRNAMHFDACSVSRVSNYFTTRELFRSVDVSGYKNEEFSFSVWAKCFATLNTKLKAFITFNYDTLGSKTYFFDFEKNLSSWQLLSRSILTEDDYDSIELGVMYDGAREAYFDAFQLCKDSYGQYYNYDKWGNLVETISSSGNRMRIESEIGKPKSIILQDGSHYKYDYNNDGYLSRITDANDNSVCFDYDANGNVIEYEIESGGNEYIGNSFEYDTNDNLVSKIDEFSEETYFEYDHLKRITSIDYPNQFKEEFSYDSLSNLLSLSGFNSAQSSTPDFKNEMEYDDRLETISTISALNGSEYTFIYDSAGRLLIVKNGNDVIQEFTYNLISNSVNRNLITSKKYGSNGDLFTFEYDNQDRLIRVKLNSVSIYEYEYNEFSQISLIKNLQNNTKAYYSYDLKGNLIKATSNDVVCKYEYDNLGNLQTKRIEYDTHSLVQSYDYSYEFNDYSKEGFLSRLGNNYGDELILSTHQGQGEYGLRCSFRDCGLYDDQDLTSIVFKFNDKRQSIFYDFDSINSNRTGGIINGRPFYLEEWKSHFNYTKTIYLWFKPTRSTPGENHLVRFINNHWSSKNVCVIDIDSNNKIKYVDKSGQTKLTTTNSISNDNWNFLSITIRRDNLQNKVSFNLNGTSTSETIVDEYPFYIEGMILGQNETPYINSLDESSSSAPIIDYSMHVSYLISLIGLSNRYYSADELQEMNVAWNTYFLDQVTSVVKNNSTHYINKNINDDLDIIPLNGETKSINGFKPVNNIPIRTVADKNNESPFKYDSYLMRKVYSNFANDKHETLKYQFPLTNYGTFSFWFKISSTLSRTRYIITFYDGTTSKLSIYIDSNNRCMVNKNGSTTTLKLNVTTNTWHNISFALANELGFFSFDNNTSVIPNINLSNCVAYLGCSKQKSYALNGYLENICFSDSYTNFTFDKAKKLRSVTIGDTLDALDRVTSRNFVCENNKYSSTYSYNKTRISSENILGSESISYSYDSMGNVTSISSSNRNEQYSYDQLGRLSSHNHNSGEYTESFTYDENGNILAISKTTNQTDNYLFEYSGDRLLDVKKNGIVIKTITYNSNNVFYPSSMTINGTTKTLSWSGKRLIGIGNDITYTYNEEGIRISKVTPLESTTFVIEGTNIISLSKTSNNVTYQFDFYYDYRGLLSSLSYNGNSYFYVRDVLGHILGIINSSGNYIVKYLYTAFGEMSKNIISQSGDDLIVATHNPFVYKGYYFDDETGFYYLKTRYYDPTICRFISIDDYSFLDSNDLREINLFAYCGNEPIKNLDINGNDWGSFWKGVSDFFKKTFGCYGQVSGVIIDYEKSLDFFFGGYETGIKDLTIFGDDSKPISFFVTRPNIWWRFWEYQIGCNIKTGDYSFISLIGAGEASISIGYKNTNYTFISGVNKFGFEISETDNGVTTYIQGYIRTYPTVLAAVVVCAAPYLAPAALLLLAY